MGILKDYIAKFLEENEMINDMQTGGTKGRRVTENIYMLNYCIERSFNRKSKLFILSIDFSKAYDSIDRIRLIDVLKELHIHPNLVELIANVYTQDSTTLFLNKEKITDLEISSGIRQGCNLSALLFILITYKIITTIQNLKMGYEDENFSIGSLFYMDDATIFTNELDKLLNIIGRIENICGKYGLKLNKEKCKILIINEELDRNEVEGIKIVNTIKYLGVLIDNKKKCFESQKNKIFNDANKFVGQIFAILGNSCNRMLIGKTYWKGLVLQCLLYCAEIICFTEEELKKLQTCDNKAFRYILKVPEYTAIEYLRGEIGASCSKARDIKNKILFLKHAMNEGGNRILARMVEDDLEHKRTNWAKNIHKYLNLLGKTAEQIRAMKKTQIEKAINDWDSEKWRENMREKRTMRLYRECKEKPEESKWFMNNYQCAIMMRARADSLKLGWRGLNEDKDKTCKLCNNHVETLKHFILDCTAMQKYRTEFQVLQLPRVMDEDKLLKNILLMEDDWEIAKTELMDMVAVLWNKRCKLIEQN